jgi:hypothetical protein
MEVLKMAVISKPILTIAEINKYYKLQYYKSKDKQTHIYIFWYTTKSGFLKFHIEILKENKTSGFCDKISDYNTTDNSMLRYLKNNIDYDLIYDGLTKEE